MHIPVKVAIVFCSNDHVHADFCASLVVMCSYSQHKKIPFGVINPKSSVIEVGRNNGVAAAKQLEYTHLLFLDSDVVFPPNTLERLLSHDKPIVGASYCQRRPPFKLTHTELEGNACTLDGSVREVKRLPTGCMLIRRDVLDAVEARSADIPAFYVPWIQKRAISEDNAFCDTARSLGHSCWLDTELTRQLKHLGTYAYSVDDVK